MAIPRLVRQLAAGLATVGFACAMMLPADAAYDNDHLQTYTKLPGNYATTHGTTWNTVARYVDYGDIDQRGSEDAHNAGIKVGFYTDIHLICQGTTCSGSPSLEDVPESGLAHSCTGQRIFSSDDTDAARKLLADPRQPALIDAWNRVIENKLQNSYGQFHEDFVIDDDAFIPNAPWFVWHADSPHGEAQPKPYCGYTTNSYVAAIKNMQAQAKLPVILNGLNGPPDLAYTIQAPNVLGGICEDCLHTGYDASRNREVGAIWKDELTAALQTGAQGKVWIAYPHGAIDDDTQGFIYASLMLVYSPNHVALDEDVATPSGIPLPPTVFLIPRDSRRAMPHHMEELRVATNVYGREFAHCFIRGNDVGACAAVVNADATHAHRLPFPRSRYRHSLTMSGHGIAAELGDNGQITATGPPPPEWLGARGWAIIFQ